MTHAICLALALTAPPPPLVTGMKNPESVVIAQNGKTYVSVIGEFGKDGDGSIVVIEGDKAVPFATGLDDPKGLVAFGPFLYVADKTCVLRINDKGEVQLIAGPEAFPTPPKFLNDLVVDPESGFTPTFYVSDSGDLQGKDGAVYRITLAPPPKKGNNAPPAVPKASVTLVADAKSIPGLHTPNGLALDGRSHLLVADFGTGDLHRFRLADKTVEKVAGGFNGADGLAWDYHGRLFVTDWKTGKLFVIPRAGAEPIQIPVAFEQAADLCVDHKNRRLLIPDMKAGTLTAIPAVVSGQEVDESAMPLQSAVAFPDLKWQNWTAETDAGRQIKFRPIELTHAGDGTNRVFVGEQHGMIFTFPNDQKATTAKVFLDIRDKVHYDDRANEEGLLGIAFHPKYKETGEVFVYYTPKGPKSMNDANRVNLVVRFKVKKDDPDALDPASEEVVYKFEKRPFWNHAGGPICFGPDGYLYIAHGDGGAANDPHDNGQNLATPFGKILRIDVNKKADGKGYAVPADNPFVGRKGALPEIFAYGLRNVWKIAFDRKTGKLWAGEVGQNLYEEINLIEKGGNYGWNRRESYHPFGAKGVGVKPEYIDPIWEYHHDVGKSITGGHVYRGTKLPELDGHYLYADYVTNRVWALKYDDAAKRVMANRPIKDRGRPVFAFGTDEQGEVYFMTETATGKEGLFMFTK